MSVQIFLIMLLVFSGISGSITEAIKKFINDKANYSSNIIVLIVSLIVGGIGMVIYYVLNELPISTNEIIYTVLMAIATWLVAMLGYDKVVQSINQIKNTNKTEETE